MITVSFLIHFCLYVTVQAELLASNHILRPVPREHEEHGEWSQADLHGHDVSSYPRSAFINVNVMHLVTQLG